MNINRFLNLFFTGISLVTSAYFIHNLLFFIDNLYVHDLKSIPCLVQNI